MKKNPLLGRQDATLSIRLYKNELEAIKEAAKKLNMPISDYVKKSCLARARRAA